MKPRDKPKTPAEDLSRSAIPEPGVVDYPEVWPGVDLRYTVRGGSLKEDIVIKGSSAPSEFVFDIAGADFVLGPDGSVQFTGEFGKLFFIPPPKTLGPGGADVTGPSGVRYEVRDPNGAEPAAQLAVILDAAWLAAQPSEAFPLSVDPSYWGVTPTSAAAETFNFSNPAGGGYAGDPIGVGRANTAQFHVLRTRLHFNQYLEQVAGNYRAYYSFLNFIPQAAGTGNTAISVYEQGAKPNSWAEVGEGKPLIGTLTDTGALNPVEPLSVWTNEVVDRWLVENRAADQRYFGIRGTESGITFRQYAARFYLRVFLPPPPSVITNIADNGVVATTTPTLNAQSIPAADDGDLPMYDYQITTGPTPGTGQVFSSGGVQATSWQVPPGTLQEGVTYYAWVLTDWTANQGHVPKTFPDPVTATRRFKIDLGLGEGGNSPVDEVGSVPGQAAHPAEGAPSPGLPASKLTVNMVDGNASLSLATPKMATVGGGAALSFTYNTLATGSQGLRGEFYNDTDGSGAISAGDTLVGQRTDPTVGFDWGTYARAVVAHDPTKALARWSGSIKLPTTGTWQLGAISSDGLKITRDGAVVLDRWAAHAPEAAPVWGSSFSATAGDAKSITIDWKNSTSSAVARVFARDMANPSAVFGLSPEWLSRSPQVLPPGWTMNATGDLARWVGLEDQGSAGVSLFAADGSAHEFRATGNGSYTPPATAPTDLLTAGVDGRFVVRGGGGETYTFRTDGVLESLVTSSNDRAPAALVYGYSGTPVRLTTMTDPVSNRAITLSYGGDAACSGVPAEAAGLLCKVAFWDGTEATLTYDNVPRLTRITMPGGPLYDLAYDASSRLTGIRDPLAVEAIAAGVRADDATTKTEVAYDTSGRVSTVTQPAPTSGAARPKRTYGYDPANRTTYMTVAGFTPTSGYAKRVRYDDRSRIIETADPAGLLTAFAWDTSDRMISSRDPAGIMTTTAYDHASRPTTTYGPAPASSFQPNGLPVGGATVPTTTKTIDGGIQALGAAYWTNPYLAGAPALHDTGLGTAGAMDGDWGAAPPVTPGAGGWSGRWAGFITSAADSYQFQVVTKGSKAQVFVDDTLVVDHNQAEPADWATTTGTATALTAGPHRIRVDLVDTSGPAGLQVAWKQGAGSFAVIPGSVLSPNYGLVTDTVDPDGKAVRTEYSDAAAGIGPHYGVATATVADPAGLALRTATTYETPGPGTFLRRVAKALPAGNVWAYANYGGTEGPVAAVCGVASGTAQGGLPKRVTGPDPDSAGPEVSRVEEFAYDAAGRQRGRRVGNANTISSAGWECTTYDSKGRVTSRTWPAHGGAPARTLTHTYGFGGSPPNPLVNRVTDTEWGSAYVSATADLLSRPTSYTDIWANTTTTSYDQAGRTTTKVGPLGTHTQNYDAATGRESTFVANGTTLSTPSYDAASGRLASVSYANTTATALWYDTNGRSAGVTHYDQQSSTGETIARSLGGRVIDQSVFSGGGFVDATPGANSYLYDGAGRLAKASLPGVAYDYGFGTAVGCAAPGAGANTNRTSLTVTGAGAGTTTSCYDAADRLVSSTTLPAGSVAYDDHGNTLTLGDQALEFDAADRHVLTETPANLTRYRRDPLDRIAERTNTTRIAHVATTSATAQSPSVTVNRPTGTQPGDAIVAAVTAASTGTLDAPGWTVASTALQGSQRTWALWRAATASDPSSWSFNVSGPLANTVTGALSSYRNGAGTPIGVTATATAASATSHPVAAVTTTGDAQHLVHVAGFGADVTATAPPTSSSRAAVPGPGLLAPAASLLVADRYQRNAGASESASATTPTSVASASLTLALVPVTTVARPGYVDHSDNMSVVRDGAAALVEYITRLHGGATYTHGGVGNVWSHTNTHGDTVTTTDAAGNRTWTGFPSPYGEPASGAAPTNTSVGGATFGWHGAQARTTERDIVQLGARSYVTSLGRFTRVDPVEGGCANDYVYVFGDPVDETDLDGRDAWGWAKRAWKSTGGKVFTCDDNRVTKSIELFSVIPPFGGGSKRDWALYAASLQTTVYGTVGSLAASRLPNVAGAAFVRVAGKASTVLTATATVYDVSRRIFC